MSGLRVLDLGQAGVGPYAAGLLAQMGADVIKCEPPDGDIINRSGGRVDQSRPSSLYIAANLSKRGIVLDLKVDEDRSRFYDLVSTAHVYMDNMKAGTAEKLGIGFDVLSRVNPTLVWVNSSGFGDRGPLSAVGSFEQYSDAFAGVSSITGMRGGRPQRLSQLRVDPFTACCLVTMVLAGLAARQSTGKGQKVVGSQFQSALQLGMVRSIEALNWSTPAPMGTEHPHYAPSGLFRALDADLALSAVTEQQWRNLCLVVDRPMLIFAPNFSNNRVRVQHRDELTAELRPLFAARPVQQWVDLLQARRVPAGPVLSPRGLAENPHVRAAGMLRTVDTHWGPIDVPGVPARFSRTPTCLRSGPRRGEHNQDILGPLSTEKIAE